MIPVGSSFFITGGTMGQETPSYVARRADTELYDGLRAGEFCYVLTARQMGKSSLMVRTANRLRDDGFSVATLDLTVVGQNLTLEQWYYGLLNLAGRQLNLRAELRAFWTEHQELGPLQRFMLALEQVLLASLDEKAGSAGLVIFVDEIDHVKSLSFSTDELFAAIRQCYNRRAEEPALNRLTFCLLGVTSPSQLIRDPRTTPFNVGRRIELYDFGEAEAQPLAWGLQWGGAVTPLRTPQVAQRLLQRVLFWTHGHPYLTQRLCREVAESEHARDARAVDRICRALFLTSGARNQDDNLLFVQERLVTQKDLAGYLDLYRRIRSGKRVPSDETEPRVPELRLSGIVREERGFLQVRNRIYHQVFDTAWIDARMPGAELQRQKAAYRQGFRRSAALAGAVVAVTGGLAGWGGLSSYRAQKSETTARRLAAERGEALTHASLLLYTANVKSAWQAVDAGSYDQALQLLEAQEPKNRREPDFRSWEWYYLWSVCRPERRLLPGHGIVVSELVFTPGGSALVSSDGYQMVVRHDLTARTDLTAFTPSRHEQRMSTAISGTGKTFFTLTRPETSEPPTDTQACELRAVDLSSGRERLLVKYPGALSQLHTNRAGDLVAAVARNEQPRRVHLWDDTGHPLGVLRDGARSVRVMAVAPDGSLIATGNVEGEVLLWNRRTLRPQARLKCSGAPIEHLTFSENGGTLLVAADRIRAIDVRTRSVGPKLVWHGKRIFTLAVSPDGKKAAAATFDGTNVHAAGEVEVWDLIHGSSLRRLRGHTGAITALAFADRRTLATGGWDSTVRLWDLEASSEPEVHHSFGGPQYGLAFWPTSASAAILGKDAISLFDTTTWLPGPSLSAPAAKAMEVSPDGTTLAAVTGREVLLWSGPSASDVIRLPHPATVTGTAFAPDSARLATIEAAGTVRIWDLKTRVATRYPEAGRAAAFDPLGGGLAVASSDGSLALEQGPRGTPLRVPLTALGTGPMRFSPDGRYLAVRTRGVLTVFDRVSSTTMLPKGISQDIRTLAFSPNSKTLIGAGEDRAIHVWNLATGQELGTLKGSAGGNGIAFSPDGTNLTAAGADGVTRVWTAAASPAKRR